MAEYETQVEEGPLPVLKWDKGLFEHITRGFQFPSEWDARYPRQGQTAADAPPGYITLFEDFFVQGNFRLPAMEFMASILHFYAKKILLNPPKSFHDWKMKFFFIREEVIQIAMIFREPDTIDKEELSIPKRADWYLKLSATPNRIFCENVLVAVQVSDKWPETSNKVPILKFAAFPTFGGSMGVRLLQSGEPFWYDQIKGHFLYPPAGAFVTPPSATKGALLPKSRLLRGVTSAGKEILFLSSEESVGSSQEESSSWSKIFLQLYCTTLG
ncbi:hypothetical protein Hdeb2414_s0006g00211251 [Helianthus debilis subsp. tardiflorus]